MEVGVTIILACAVAMIIALTFGLGFLLFIAIRELINI